MRKFHVVCLVFFLSLSAYTQQYHFINYTTQDGLAQSQVRDICQDDQGYIWIGTSGGLSRFNGIDFDNYSVDDGLPDNNIRRLYHSHDGKIWVGTPRGVAYYVGGEFISFPFEEQNRINDIAEFQNEILFAGNKGLLSFRNEGFDFLNEKDSTDYFFRAIENYNDSILFCGSKYGLYAWDGEELELIEIPGVGKVNVRDLKIKGHEMYIAARGKGVLRYNFKTKATFLYDLDYTKVLFLEIFGETVFGINSGGEAFIIEDNEVEYFSKEKGLFNNSFTSFYRDVEGIIWMGTDGQGLLKFSGESVVSYMESDGLSSSQVLAITQDVNGKFTFGTYQDGITQMTFPDKEVKIIQSGDDLIDNTIWSVFTDKENRVWVGSSRGLNVLDQDGNVLSDVGSVDDGRKLRTIIAINDSTMAMGGDEGLTIMGPDSVYSIHENLNINDLHILDNKMYCASFDALYEFELNSNFESYNLINIPETNVNTLTSDYHGNLWIGTMNGLFVRNRGAHLYRFPLDELDYRSKSVLGLITTKNNSVWVSTMHGVYEIREDLKAINGYKVLYYGNAEGVVNEECNINALYEDDLGKIWVGTAGGLVRIDPALDSVVFDYKKPNLHITGIRMFMEEFDYMDYSVQLDSIFGVPTEMELPYNKNHLTFDFIGINLKNPNAVQYEHRMIGATDEWSPISSTNTATYSFLPSGDYQFQVRAMNKSNNWSTVKVVHIIINPPFWKTWWFISICVIAVFLIVYFLFRARIRVIRQRQDNEKLELKNRLLFLEQRSLNASMNRHFIFNSLNSIQYFINSSDKLSANRFLSNFAKLIRKNLDSSASTNFIVTLQEEVERIELYLALEKMRFSDKFEYQLDVSSSLDTESIEIPSMILQPFVENSIIHGVLAMEEGGMIKIKIYEDLGEVVFVVQDNGVGIDTSLAKKKETSDDDHQSKGVEITNRRIELLRKLTGENLLIIGPFQMNNEAGDVLGTKVILKLGGTHKFD